MDCQIYSRERVVRVRSHWCMRPGVWQYWGSKTLLGNNMSLGFRRPTRDSSFGEGELIVPVASFRGGRVGQLYCSHPGPASTGSGCGSRKNHVWTGERVGSGLEVWRKWLGSEETGRGWFPFHSGAGCLPSFDRRGKRSIPGPR